MIRRPPRSTRSDTLFPYTALVRSFFGGAIVLKTRGRSGRTRLSRRRHAELVSASVAGPFLLRRAPFEGGPWTPGSSPGQALKQVGNYTLGIRKPPYFVISSGAKQSRAV